MSLLAGPVNAIKESNQPLMTGYSLGFHLNRYLCPFIEEDCSGNGLIRHRGDSKIKQVGELGDQGPFQGLSGAGTSFIVDQKNITQRFVDEIETDIAGNFLERAVVLNQRIEKHPGAEGIAQASGEQVGIEISGRERDVGVIPGNIGRKLIARLK